MHLMYTVDADGKRNYTLHKVIDGEVTKSAHPARFSPDDKYSRYGTPRNADCMCYRRSIFADDVRVFRQRVTLKKRYGLLVTQQSMCPQSPAWSIFR